MWAVVKFLTPLIHPMGLAWASLIVTAAVCHRRGRRLGTVVAATAASLLWLVGQPRITQPLCGQLEKPWLDSTVDQAPLADAVLVLGGGWSTSPMEVRHLKFNDAVDRLFAGHELCRRGRAPVLVLGGDVATPPPGVSPESSRLRLMLREHGLPDTEILTLGPVLTTADEASRAAALARQRGWKRILLVTSAFHMRRALATFQKAGVPVHPVACDFRYARKQWTAPGWNLAPGDECLADLGVWWHEQIGWLAYRLLGRA